MNERDLVGRARADLLEGIGIPEPTEFKPDPFQLEAIEHVMEGRDTLVVAPTGSGKTYIAVEAISGYLSLKARSVYTTPLKALSNTKYAELKRRFEPDAQVGLLTGDRKIEGDADVVVATTEIYRNELYSASARASLVVLDEVHFIADPQRGPVWEESIILTPESSTLLMLSASISNAVEIAEWISEVRNKECQIVTKQERPVELRYGFMHPELGVIPLRDRRGHVFREVRRFYASVGLDSTGMRLRGKGGRGGRGPNKDRRGRRR